MDAAARGELRLREAVAAGVGRHDQRGLEALGWIEEIVLGVPQHRQGRQDEIVALLALVAFHVGGFERQRRAGLQSAVEPSLGKTARDRQRARVEGVRRLVGKLEVAERLTGQGRERLGDVETDRLLDFRTAKLGAESLGLSEDVAVFEKEPSAGAFRRGEGRARADGAAAAFGDVGLDERRAGLVGRVGGDVDGREQRRRRQPVAKGDELGAFVLLPVFPCLEAFKVIGIGLVEAGDGEAAEPRPRAGPEGERCGRRPRVEIGDSAARDDLRGRISVFEKMSKERALKIAQGRAVRRAVGGQSRFFERGRAARGAVFGDVVLVDNVIGVDNKERAGGDGKDCLVAVAFLGADQFEVDRAVVITGGLEGVAEGVRVARRPAPERRRRRIIAQALFQIGDDIEVVLKVLRRALDRDAVVSRMGQGAEQRRRRRAENRDLPPKTQRRLVEDTLYSVAEPGGPRRRWRIPPR